MSEYPKRANHFAHRFVRLLAKTCAAMEIGPDGCWLLTVIAMLEDSKRYTDAVKFFNAQLMAVAGFTREHTLIAARNRAVGAGLLFYEQGGRRVPGRYWVLIPSRFADVTDGPCDEDDTSTTDEIVSPSSTDSLGTTDEIVSDLAGNASVIEQGMRQRFLPSPIPIPIPNKKRARNRAVDERLLGLAKAWNELGPSIAPTVKLDPLPKAVREGWKKVHADPEVRAVFDNIPALMKAIRAATFCHGKGYFTLAWIFTRDRQTKELRAAKILAGAYSDPKATLSQDRFFFNPERPIDEKF